MNSTDKLPDNFLEDLNPEQTVKKAVSAVAAAVAAYEYSEDDKKEIKRLKRLIRKGELPRYQVKKVQVTNASGRTSTEFRMIDSISVIMGSKAIQKRILPASDASADSLGPSEASSQPEAPQVTNSNDVA